MISREEVLKEVARIHDSYLTSGVRKEALTDYIMRLIEDVPFKWVLGQLEEAVAELEEVTE